MDVKNAPIRRTQEERSSATRARLLDATLECLLELGYAGTTTPLVCERSGLSRGALLHHFPTKQDLVIEAVRRLVIVMNEANLAQAARVAEGTDPLERMFELIWTNFEQPLFHVALELWLASRTDRELHASLLNAERARGRGMARWYQSLAGSAAECPGFADVLQLTLHLMRGMALQRMLTRDDAARARLYALWREMARAYLEAEQAEARP